jgi:hypothetical protein
MPNVVLASFPIWLQSSKFSWECEKLIICYFKLISSIDVEYILPRAYDSMGCGDFRSVMPEFV